MAKKNEAAKAASGSEQPKEYQLNQPAGIPPAAEGTAPPSMVAGLTAPASSVDLAKFERLNNPPMVLATDIPVGAEIVARFIKAIPSPVTTVKGNLLWLQHGNGTEFTFPCTGVIRSALLPGSDDEKENREKNLAKLNKDFAGKTIYLKRLDNKPSKKGTKNMFMFDVRVSK